MFPDIRTKCHVYCMFVYYFDALVLLLTIVIL